MVIGTGLMAKTFADYSTNTSVIIFASGVSNSIETGKTEFEREFDLLSEKVKLYPDKKLVYFSTLGIEDKAVSDRPYTKHKLRIESFIKMHAKDFLIFRVTNVVGPDGNPNTIMNYLVNAVKNQVQIDLWKYAERNLIDKDDLKLIVDEIILSNIKNEIVNVALGQSFLVTEIVKQIEIYLNKRANINLINKGCALQIDTTKISQSLAKIELQKSFGSQYIFNLLEKYY